MITTSLFSRTLESWLIREIIPKWPKNSGSWNIISFTQIYPHQINVNFRILKWRYCTICLAIFWGDIPWNLGLTYALYMVGTSNLGCPSENNHKLFAPRSLEPMRAAPARQWPPRQWPPPLAAAPRTRALKPRKAKAGMDHNIRYPSVIH